MEISVANWKRVSGAGITGEYIGRPNPEFQYGSPLANPYKIGADGTRRDVIEKYRRWLWRQVRERKGAAYEGVVRLERMAQEQDLVLICWCAPAACHGDVIRRAIEWLQANHRSRWARKRYHLRICALSFRSSRLRRSQVFRPDDQKVFSQFVLKETTFMHGTRLYSAQGTLRSEDHQVRSVARSRIDSALVELERKYDALASQLVLKKELASLTDVGDIITRVRAHSLLEGEFATLDRYTGSFPELQSYVEEKLARIERHTRRLVSRQARPILH